MTFNEIVRNVRGQLGITQEQLAHELNISFSTVNRWENGHNTPSRLAKMRLLEYINEKNINIEMIAILEKL